MTSSQMPVTGHRMAGRAVTNFESPVLWGKWVGGQEVVRFVSFVISTYRSSPWVQEVQVGSGGRAAAARAPP